MTTELNVYAVRPDGTALWLPEVLATSLGITYGTRLTREQFGSEDIQGLIQRRLAAEKKKKEEKVERR